MSILTKIKLLFLKIVFSNPPALSRPKFDLESQTSTQVFPIVGLENIALSRLSRHNSKLFFFPIGYIKKFFEKKKLKKWRLRRLKDSFSDPTIGKV